jgi:hypothetical protein
MDVPAVLIIVGTFGASEVERWKNVSKEEGANFCFDVVPDAFITVLC